MLQADGLLGKCLSPKAFTLQGSGGTLPRVVPSVLTCLCGVLPFPLWQQTPHVLIIEATSPAGGVSILPEGVSELLVEGVSQASGDALPGQDENDDHSVLAVVACPVPHQAEQLLLQRVPANHLQEGRARGYDDQDQAPIFSLQMLHAPYCFSTDLDTQVCRAVSWGWGGEGVSHSDNFHHAGEEMVKMRKGPKKKLIFLKLIKNNCTSKLLI